MPYIPQEHRFVFKKRIKDVIDSEPDAGELNFLFSSIIWGLFRLEPSYRRANELMGVLECVKQEFYRRQIANYEDQKIKSNGDLE